MMKKLLMWGASGHARVIADIVRLRGEYQIVAAVHERTTGKSPESFDGVPILADREAVLRLRDDEGVADVIIGVGDCVTRMDLALWCIDHRFSVATAVHPSAVISPSARVGAGTVIMAGAAVNAGAVIGANVIINTGATVDHDCILEDGCHLSPGVHLGGLVRVGQAAWLGVGTSVRDRMSIGRRSVVGVGSAVVSDIPEGVVAYGNPARVRRSVEEAKR